MGAVMVLLLSAGAAALAVTFSALRPQAEARGQAEAGYSDGLDSAGAIDVASQEPAEPDLGEPYTTNGPIQDPAADVGDAYSYDDEDPLEDAEAYVPAPPVATGRGVILYVDVSGNDAWDGLAPAWDGAHGPKRTIQAAINAAAGGDEISVAAGTYTEAINLLGKAVYLHSSAGPEATIINGTGLGTSVVTCTSSEGLDTIVEGFTVTGGTGTVTGLYSRGGGMYNYNSSPTVWNCIFTGNQVSTTYGYGGGMATNNGFPTVAYCRFIENQATFRGGGMCNELSSPTVVNCVFSGNSSGRYGGGLQNWDSEPTVVNCIFTGNTAVMTGGAACTEWYAVFTAANCTFSGNTSDNGVGGIFAGYASSSILTNCIVWGETGGAIGGSTTVTYSDIEGGYSGTGNINAAPQFLDASGGYYQLSAGSPCIDAGNTLALPPDTADLDGDGNTTEPVPFDAAGNLRIVDGNGDGTPVVDMGAYEYPIFYVDLSATTGADDGSSWTNAFLDLQDALVAAGSGGEIWVAAGVYRPGNVRKSTFQLVDGVAIYGGFASGGGDGTFAARNPTTYVTTLSGDVGTQGQSSDNCYHVVKAVGTGAATVLDGFTIMGGNANGASPSNQGGGMYVSDGGPTVSTCTFTNNVASAEGGGMAIIDSSAGDFSLVNCAFAGNEANKGGGLYYDSRFDPGDLSIADCAFTGNSAQSDGGGIYSLYGTVTTNHCTFNSNSAGAAGRGGGMCIEAGEARVAGCAFGNNSAGAGGGGISYGGGLSLFVVNSKFYGNTASGYGEGGAISVWDVFLTALVANCTFSGNAAQYGRGTAIFYHDMGGMPERSFTTVNCTFSQNGQVPSISLDYQPYSVPLINIHNCVAGASEWIEPFPFPDPGQPWPSINYNCMVEAPCYPGGPYGMECGEGNIVLTDPWFVDADGPDDIVGTADDDLRLDVGSLCIDVGQNAAVPADMFDLDADGNTSEKMPFDLAGWPRFEDDPATPDCAAPVHIGGDPGPPRDCGTPPIVDTGAYEYFTDCNRNDVPDDQETPYEGPLHVDDDATGLNDGSSWADAFTELSDALVYARCIGDSITEIHVAGGTYYPFEAHGAGPRYASFALIDGLAIYGGYAGLADPGNPDTRDVTLYETVLSGDIGTPDDPSDNCYHVVKAVNTSAATVLDGFTITDGNANGTSEYANGGGMYNNGGAPTVSHCTFSGNTANWGAGMCNISSSPTVTDCAFSANTADADGGGMHNVGGAPTVSHCTFSGNTANWGAGMCNISSSPTVTSCTFSGNTAAYVGGGMHNHSSSPTVTTCAFTSNTCTSGPGGGMYNHSGSPTVTTCTFSGNAASSNGGGMFLQNVNSSATVTNCTFSGNGATWGAGLYNYDSDTTITNCAFSGNSASDSGGGMLNQTGSDPTITNCTFGGNTADVNGGGMCNYGNSAPTVANCIFWGNTNGQIYPTGMAGVTWCCVQDGYIGNGNITTDPRLATDRVHLLSGSPCIDAGDNAAVPAGVDTDLDGDPRFADDPATVDTGNPGAPGPPIVDIGADEYWQDCNTNGIPDSCDLTCVGSCGTEYPGCGQSSDCNDNDFPDECEVPPLGTGADCNTNGVPDVCDVPPIGTGPDCQPNGIPDECEVPPLGTGPDCQPNGIPDACDISGGGSDDYDASGVPDECEDCNGNGVADACDVDCSTGNCVDHPDGCDIEDQFSRDCDTNGVPDECDIAGDPNLDVDDDGVMNICDNCPYVYNPDQADANTNGFGDACENTVYLGEELLPPENVGFTIDPSQTELFSGDPETVFVHDMGTPDGADDHWFARYAPPAGAPVTLRWWNAGKTESFDAAYLIAPGPPVAPNDYNRHVSAVSYFPNYHTSTLEYDDSLAPSVHFNPAVPEDCDGQLDDDILLQNGLITIDTDCITSSTTPRYVLIQYDESPGGPLVGFEVLTIVNAVVQDSDVPIGRRLAKPAGADDSRAEVRQGLGQYAWQRPSGGTTGTTDIYPITPNTQYTQFVVSWFHSSQVVPFGELPSAPPWDLGWAWPVAVTRHKSHWPDAQLGDDPPQVHVVDGSEALPVVDLRTVDLYSGGVEWMSEAPPAGSSTGPLAQIVEYGGESYFAAVNPGWTVLKFEGSGPEDVTFEVVRSYSHDEAPVFDVNSNGLAWPVGTSIERTDLHDRDTPDLPYGFLYDGQPYAPCVYDDLTPDCNCTPGEGTGQIIPVNDSRIGEYPEHGLLEVWYFQAGRETADGNFAGGIRWPYAVRTYETFWPDTPCDDPVGTPGLCKQIIIASRLGTGPDGIGAGDYGPQAKIYKSGRWDDGLLAPTTTLGWNPNDEHGSLVSIGGRMLAFATRDDDPWGDLFPGDTTGHPYVLVQYWDDALEPPRWAMDVLKVVEEYPPDFTLDFAQFASLNAQTGELEFSPVYAGLPLNPPLFPMNVNVPSDPPPCAGGPLPVEIVAPTETSGLWADRNNQVWTVSDQPGSVRLWEKWGQDGDELCEPWCPDGNGDPTPVSYDPAWPPYGEDCVAGGPCVHVDASVGDTWERDACSFDVLRDEVGVRIIDPGLASTVDYAGSVPDFSLLPPHLASGKDFALGTILPDRIESLNSPPRLRFTGIMSDRDRDWLLSPVLWGGGAPPGAYQTAIQALYTQSREQLDPGYVPDPGLGFTPHLTVGDPGAVPGYVTTVQNNDPSCGVELVQVEVWHAACPPAEPEIRVFATACPLGETVVLQVDHDAGGYPEGLAYQWQYQEIGDPAWHNWMVDSPDQFGLRELVLSGPEALADRTFRVRYRGYAGCPCDAIPDNGIPDCPVVGDGEDQWPWDQDGTEGSACSEWSPERIVPGWVKRVVAGLNPFDSRLTDFHDPEGANYTYMTMLEQAGVPLNAETMLSCDPEALQETGLIEAYESVTNRLKSFTIFQRPATTAENLAIQFITGKVSDLYRMLADEAYADACDPTIGLDFDIPGVPDPTYSSLYAFEGEVLQGAGGLLDEELALLRGTDQDAGDNVALKIALHNRLRWNFDVSDRGEATYISTYNITNKDEDPNYTIRDAQIMYPQGHGDAWGHYLTAMKNYYQLLRDNNFEWIVATEQIASGTGTTTPVTYQYERRFAQAAAAKARTGADLVDLTFRQRYTADPAADASYPDTDPDRAWGVADWARRAGQGAYFDWATANALLDDDDSGHQGVERVDRSTVPELKEIAASFADIQTTLDNAGNGLNPLGLATNVVPFGISVSQLEAGISHYQQVRCWALRSLQNAKILFDYANHASRRLRNNQDAANDFSVNVAAQEQDYKARLVEIFGRPYDEDLGTLYPADYDGPDIFHFEYVDPSPLLDDPLLAADAFATTYSTRFTDYHGLINGDPNNPQEFDVSVNVSVCGLGLIRPAGWGPRPEPGEIQVARAEAVQAIGELRQTIAVYDAHLRRIQSEIQCWRDLTLLNASILKYRTGYQTDEQDIHDYIKAAHGVQTAANLVAERAVDLADAVAEAFPKSVGLSMDATAPARSFAKLKGAIFKTVALAIAVAAENTELWLEQSLAEAGTQVEIDILRVTNDAAEAAQISVIEQLMRETPALQLEVQLQMEAVQQAAGRYQQAIGRGVRLLDQLVALRKNLAGVATEYRFKDFTFRILRNESLQKYRAMFDMAARYTYLAAKAYDYDTNRPTTARNYLEDIVRQRALGFVPPDNVDCNTWFAVPTASAGLAGQLWQLDAMYDPENQFSDDVHRTFNLRQQVFLAGGDDAAWRQALSRCVVPDLLALPEYRLYADLLQCGSEPCGGPALVIPFSTTIDAELNYFCWQINGPNFASDAYATKFLRFEVQFVGLPPDPYLIPTVNVYLLPVGNDIMRVPEADGSRIRVWNLIDQALPRPIMLGNYEDFDWMPWATWGPGNVGQSIVRRRQPSVAACDPAVGPCDDSSSLVARSVWNDRWVLVIPDISLSVNPTYPGIDTFINGVPAQSIPGVSDIRLVIDAVKYNWTPPKKADETEGGDGQQEQKD